MSQVSVRQKIPDVIHTDLNMYKCVQMDLHFLVYEYVKLFTRTSFTSAFSQEGEGCNVPVLVKQVLP